MAVLRFFCALVLVFLWVPSAHAASSDQWQAQLQKDLQALQKNAASVQASGAVNVTDENGIWTAQFPTLTIKGSDASGSGMRWVVQNMRMVAQNPTGNTIPVTITLPAEILKQDASGKTLARATIGSQNLAGVWNFSKGGFESLTGGLKTIAFRSIDGRDNTTLDSMTVQDTTPLNMTVLLSNMKAAWTSDKGPSNSHVKSLRATYGFADGQHFTLVRLLGLISPAIFLNDNAKMNLDVAMQGFEMNEGGSTVSAIGSMNTKAQIIKMDDGDTVMTRQEITVTDVTRSPLTIYGVFLPKELRMNGTINALPIGFLNVLGGENISALSDSMTAKGTRLDLSEIFAQLDGKTTAKGYGWLKADNTTPMGYVGRLNVTITDLQALSARLQQDMLRGGEEGRAKTGAFMLIMAVQGFAKQNGANHDVVIDLTADGAVMVNGQDISGLIGKKAPVSGL